MSKIAELDGYELHATAFGYRIEEPEINREYSIFGLLSVTTDDNTVGIATTSGSDQTPEAVAEYANVLLDAVKVADYFQAVINDREN